MFPEVKYWRGTFAEWRAATGMTQKEAANWLECGKRRIQALDDGGEGNYRLRRPDRIAMLAAVEALAHRNTALALAEGKTGE